MELLSNKEQHLILESSTNTVTAVTANQNSSFKFSAKFLNQINLSSYTKPQISYKKMEKIFLILIIGLYLQLIFILTNGPFITLVTASAHHQQAPTSQHIPSKKSIKCGDLKQCSAMFREATLSHNLSYDLSNARIEQMCIKLNKAVRCFDDYRAECMDEKNYHQREISTYDQMSEGPLGLTMELCNNPSFKQDYLTLGPCQKKYRTEFEKCLSLNQDENGHSLNLTKKITDKMTFENVHNETIVERFVEHCCALYNYQSCVYQLSHDKCGPKAADYSLKILELFNQGYLRDCARYSDLAHLCVELDADDQHNHLDVTSYRTAAAAANSSSSPQISDIFLLLIGSLVIMIALNNQQHNVG